MTKSKYSCPKCQRTIFNRRLSNCEFCGMLLPAELLFTTEEREVRDAASAASLAESTDKLQESEKRLREKRRTRRRQSYFWTGPWDS